MGFVDWMQRHIVRMQHSPHVDSATENDDKTHGTHSTERPAPIPLHLEHKLILTAIVQDLQREPNDEHDQEE